MSWAAGAFAARVVGWQRCHGRRGLPWQGTRDPYRVWLSEVMLQQTQVATALPYYERFLARFPDVTQLAAAHEDEVLALWAGLGYYSRARNLHRAARVVAARPGAAFPQAATALAELPGVGRSTAAAIAAFCFGERAAILDGNVRRVLARVFALQADVSRPQELRALWALADSLLPADPADMPAYTQGLMDLGASICTQRRPACVICPLVDGCRAAAEGAPERYPVRARRAARTQVELWLLLARDAQGGVWLSQRPASGIWARLYGLPMFASRGELLGALAPGAALVEHPPRRHVLTHRELMLHVVEPAAPIGFSAPPEGAWYSAAEWQNLALPAPIKRVLLQQREQDAHSPSNSR